MLSAQSFKFLGITLFSGSGEASFPDSKLRSQRGSVRPSHQRLGPGVHPRVSELAGHRWQGGIGPGGWRARRWRAQAGWGGARGQGSAVLEWPLVSRSDQSALGRSGECLPSQRSRFCNRVTHPGVMGALGPEDMTVGRGLPLGPSGDAGGF